MHWGPYAVPGVASEWFWYQWNRYMVMVQGPYNVPGGGGGLMKVTGMAVCMCQLMEAGDV